MNIEIGDHHELLVDKMLVIFFGSSCSISKNTCDLVECENSYIEILWTTIIVNGLKLVAINDMYMSHKIKDSHY
jgi:hypothetical protein